MVLATKPRQLVRRDKMHAKTIIFDVAPDPGQCAVFYGQTNFDQIDCDIQTVARGKAARTVTIKSITVDNDMVTVCLDRVLTMSQAASIAYLAYAAFSAARGVKIVATRIDLINDRKLGVPHTGAGSVVLDGFTS